MNMTFNGVCITILQDCNSMKMEFECCKTQMFSGDDCPCGFKDCFNVRKMFYNLYKFTYMFLNIVSTVHYQRQGLGSVADTINCIMIR